MKMNKLFLILLLGFVSVAANAGEVMVVVPPSYTSDTDTDDSVYAGLKWTLNKGTKPEVVVGYRHARVKSNGDVDGGDLSFSFTLLDGFKPGKIRTKYFDGKEKAQGEVSVGYDFANGLFVGAGAKAPYSNLGVDYLLSADNPWEAYFILDTLKEYDVPRKKANCPEGYTFNSGTCEFDGFMKLR
ncbi:MAG: hypothetical protein KBT51_09355 [Cycloclasticus sp.]|nr:hypothetical protein [Cycloclasticus sp.]